MPAYGSDIVTGLKRTETAREITSSKRGLTIANVGSLSTEGTFALFPAFVSPPTIVDPLDVEEVEARFFT